MAKRPAENPSRTLAKDQSGTKARTGTEKSKTEMTQKKARSKMIGSAVSPLAPKSFPEMSSMGGVQLATINSGTKYKDRDDLLVVRLAEGTQVGVFLPLQRLLLTLFCGVDVIWKAGRHVRWL